MTRHIAVPLVASAVLVTSAGCGGTSRPAPPAGSVASSRACQAPGTLTEADSGRTYCVARSARLEIFLHGTARDRWSPIEPDGDALRRVPSGKGMLALGVTGGFFVADHAGTTRLTSAQGHRTFELTVIVR